MSAMANRNAEHAPRVAFHVLTNPIRFAIALLAVSLAASASAAVLPFDEVRKGMRGYGLTVFEGNKVEKFDVEIIGVLRNIGPNQNLILAHVDSEVLKQSGVIAGMSGSPIYIDGKVVGALAYSWQFAKESIAGITPIEEMLKLSSYTGGGPTRLGPQLPAAEFVKQMASRDATKGFEAITASFATLSGATGAAIPIATPLSMSGFTSDTITRFSPILQRSGFLAVPAGTAEPSADAASQPDGFAPGDAVAAMLVQGDLNVAATGTVTHVDGEKIYGFGHPFLDMGEVQFPMATAEVVGVLPSLASSFKFANSGRVVGAFRQDRSAGILGIAGAKAEMIPIDLTLEGSRGTERYRFQIVRNAQLFPLLLAMVADTVISSQQRAAGERTLAAEIEFDVAGFEPVRIAEGWSGMQARQAMPAYLAVLANYLFSNEFSPVDIRGVKLRLRHDDSLKVAQIVEASVETPADGQINPGDTVRVHALLRPFRGEPVRHSFEVKVPDTIAPGTAHVMIGSGTLANQLAFTIAPPDPRSLGGVLDIVRKLRASTDLTVSVYSESAGVVAGGAYQPSLPPSVAAVMAADSSNSLQASVRYDNVHQAASPVGFIVDGGVKLDLPIRPRI